MKDVAESGELGAGRTRGLMQRKDAMEAKVEDLAIRNVVPCGEKLKKLSIRIAQGATRASERHINEENSMVTRHVTHLLGTRF